MVKKELGYVELEWECPSCGARNKGSQHDCQQCGAEMPEDVHFQMPASAKLDTTAETAETVAAGPDILCPWCDARNPGGAAQCSQCGGPLKEGRRRASGDVIGAYEGATPTAPARRKTTAKKAATPARRKKYTGPTVPAAKRPKNKTFAIVAFAMVAFMILFFVAMTQLSKGRDTAVATVTSVGWKSTIEMEGLVVTQSEGWRDEIPEGRRIYNCTSRVRHTYDNPVPDSVERCGTPYAVDTGTGKAQIQQDCWYDQYDSWCEYEEMVWRATTPVVLSGAGYSPSWPNIYARADSREIGRKQSFYVRLTTADGTYTYAPRSLDELLRYTEGSSWEITINALGGITDIQPR